ncbi:flagellar hook-basal body complex protein FliE [Porcipelethomonas sp.]|uniref:flagellar hook-basal body complex protein FliE n=1 Tax=Porcipelethomonas sp. TaxID=2981675 RepID=UPI003EF3FDF0
MFIVPLTEMSMSGITPLKATEQENVESKDQSFGEILKSKIQDVKDLESQSLQSAYDIATGASDDIESAMLDSTKASTAIEMTVQLTTRAVNAYKEIMSMQI